MGTSPDAWRKHMGHHERLRRESSSRRRTLCASLSALTVLAVFAIYSVWSATHRLMSPYPLSRRSISNRTGGLRGSSYRYIGPDTQPFNHDSEATRAKHLIVVACHSVAISADLRDAGTDENAWFLLDYQHGSGLPQAIVSHIQTGMDQAQSDPQSLLIFSGGETRAVTGPLTEASSYFRVADAMGLWPEQSTVRARTVTEEFATDSFENLLFSICRFKEVTGSYPQKITVVSFTFKQSRFETMHAPALHWPGARFSYIGVDPPASTGFDLMAATKGERQNAALHFETDPYGCHSEILQEKRRARNPFSRTPPYELTCPEMKYLLHYCGPQRLPKSKVPWRNI